jgi:hypothetical protein
MELSAKFKMTPPCRTVRVSVLKLDITYPIERAERIKTRFGETILLTLKESTQTFVKVFLPKRYGDLSTDDDIKSINEKSVIHALKYHGTISNSFVLETE